MDLGMGVTYLDPGSSQMGKKESIEDTARVLGRFYDGIEFRGFAQSDVEELADKARRAGVERPDRSCGTPPRCSPTSLTVQENFNYDIKGLKFVFFGDLKNNMGRSLMVMCAKLGMNFVGCGPKDCWMDEELIKTCEQIAAENGCTVKCTEDVKEAATDADVIYTDVWVSMGEPDEVWARAHQAARALPRDRPRSWPWPSPRTHIPALPAGLPRHQHHHRRRHRRALRRHGDGSRPTAVFESKQSKVVRRGREPHAHHQGRHVRHPAVACSSLR